LTHKFLSAVVYSLETALEADLSRKEVVRMAVYTILRIYQMPAANRIEATERMMEALDLHVERDYHVTDIIRESGEKPEHGKQVKLTPPAGWLQLLLRQLWGT